MPNFGAWEWLSILIIVGVIFGVVAFVVLVALRKALLHVHLTIEVADDEEEDNGERD